MKLDTLQTFSRALVEAAEERSELLGQKQAARAEARDHQTQLAEKEAAELASEREAAAQRLSAAEHRASAQPDALPATQSDDTSHAVSAEQPFDSKAILQLKIPIGTWLGFHDREPPIMARVAVRDLDKDSYIFTNRDGIKLRELTVPQLVTLIERDMVDILERKTSFRETLADGGGRGPAGPISGLRLLVLKAESGLFSRGGLITRQLQAQPHIVLGVGVTQRLFFGDLTGLAQVK